MKNRYLSILLCALLLCAFFPSALAQEGGQELTILFTTDIHSNDVPHTALLDGLAWRVGGYARLKTAVDAHTVEGSTLLMDSGDFSIGTLYQNFTQSDALELRLMRDVGYDAVALGNHDFELGEDGLRQELKTFGAQGETFPILCSNLTGGGKTAPTGQTDNPLAGEGVSNYAVLECGGFRVGVFALMGKEAIRYTPVTTMAFADPVESAKAMVKALRETEKADLVVALSHSGIMPDRSYVEEEEIASAVSGIDVILSGHYHAALPEADVVNDTVICCAGTALDYLGKLTLRRENGRWAFEHELILLDDSWAEDASIQATLLPYTDALDRDYLQTYGAKDTLDAAIAYSAFDFPDGDAMSGGCDNYPFGRLLTDAYLDALTKAGLSGVQAAAIPVGTVRGGLYQGEQTMMDVYNVLSYGFSPLDGSPGSPLVTFCVTGRELYDMCETSISLSSLLPAAQLLFGGLRYTYSAQRPLLDRVYQVELYDAQTDAYTPVERNDARLYTIATSWSAMESIALVESNSYGLISIRPKDEDGALLDTAEKKQSRIVRLPDGKTEMKEWYTLYQYLCAFSEGAHGLPEVDARYGQPAAFLRQTDADLGTFFANPSKTAWIMLAAVAVLLGLIALVVALCVRHHRKKRARKTAAAAKALDEPSERAE